MRIVNFINQEAYGVETTNFFRMGIETEYGYMEVHPCFLYEMIGCFAIFIILKLLQNRQKYEGEIFGFYLFFYGITPLHNACKEKSFYIVELLVKDPRINVNPRALIISK